MLFGGHIAELNATNNALVRSYVWGLDLSATMDGAGGVGGLLWVNQHTGSSAGVHFCAYDGNGNIVALSAASDGSESARYEYGLPQWRDEPIRVTGPMGKENPFRFSTKYQDNATDLLYYGYRYYNPSTGRWPNSDPLGEAGGINVYGFVQNNPVDYVDTEGRGILKLPPIEIPWPKLPPIEIPWPKIPPFPWPKAKLPPVNPANPIRCAGYLPFIGSSCDGGKPDRDPARAYKCCKDFMDKYKCSDKVQCVANCLQAGEANCQTEESCEKRNDCRKKAHVDCYSKCQCVPGKGVPASCIAIGLTGL